MSEATRTQTTWILPLESEQATLPFAGGKGANLAHLTRAGLPVPGGFLVTTQAYQAFVEANHLTGQIQAALHAGAVEDPEALEQASARIRALFAAGTFPPGLEEDLLAAYAGLSARADRGTGPENQGAQTGELLPESGPVPVAVRSSATAEDLPDMSFAGQQDTYLNVVGGPVLLRAVVSCWSSLWTTRAIGYRARNHIDSREVSLAVVVQEMVQSQASGVLFTANPLSGLRSETVIDATLGLGEALVSGQVEPDHYVVDTTSGQIRSRKPGAKAISIRSRAGGGTVTVMEKAHDHPALADEQVLELAHLGQQVTALYSQPQDIEWAWAGGRLFLLQSRPITSLYPVPEGFGPDDLHVFFSFGAVQGMLDPITPLGLDVWKTIFAAGAGLFGYHVNAATQIVLYSAGERLWINITGLIRNTVGRKIVPVALEMIEPSTRQALLSILDDPRLQPQRSGIRPRTALRLTGFAAPMLANVLLNLAAPEKRRASIVAGGEQVLELMRERVLAAQNTPDRDARLAEIAGLLPRLEEQNLRSNLIRFVSTVVAGIASFNIVDLLSRGHSSAQTPAEEIGWQNAVLEIYRGLPHNPTTEMDLELWKAAQAIHSDPSSLRLFEQLSPSDLAARYLAGDLPEPAMRAIGAFLERYGSRGLGEIDPGRPRWREEPTHVIDAIGSFLQIDDPQRAPDQVFARSAESAEEAVASLVETARRSRGGWLKARLVSFFARRARALLGARESPKFFAVRMFAIQRQALLEIGEEYVQAGELDRADDLVYLTLDEIERFARGPAEQRAGLRDEASCRRAVYQREMLRRQVPRLLLSDGRAFYKGVSRAESGLQAIQGSPVSPGTAAGRVRVVFDPRQAHLQPGEILVCPGTDPSWTPLFLAASGLVMEVGGMMTHGAVVAREYGIPAIVGVDQATQRLQTGQKIRIDGSTGEIDVLEERDPRTEN